MIKYLLSDRQTQMDLGIQESPYGERLLHSVFLKTETKEGKRMMRNWITQPLSDLSVIKARQETIAWEHLPSLPLDEEDLDFLEYYLAYRDQLSSKSSIISFFNTIDRLFKHDSARYIVERGVKLCIKLFKRLEELEKSLPDNPPTLIRSFAENIRNAFLFKELQTIPNMGDNEKLSDYQTDTYDYLFRHQHQYIIRELLNDVYTLDVCRTAQKIMMEKGGCLPSFSESTKCDIRSFHHPLMPHAKKNDWCLKGGNIALFTGSNMAGKSTTLKSIASIIWLAHCGLPVPASSMTCPVYDAIYTSINLPDSMRDGRSHFMAEVLRIKEILRQARNGTHCLIVFDEMFRGTNAQDAYEASVAVNRLLLEYPHCDFLISTHILEYAKHFEHHPSCNFYYMESNIKDDRFICSYRLKEGISESKVGYWIIRKELQI